jgi:hypothetical protein
MNDVSLDDLKAWTFNAVVCSESKRNRKLVAWCYPFTDEMYYRLYHKEKEVGRYGSLSVALENYNLL